MTIIDFKFQYKSFPNTNHSKQKGRNGQFILTDATRRFKEYALISAKNQYQKHGNVFKNIFDPKIHFFQVEYYFYTPKFYTKKGTVNLKKGDWDSNLKHTQDAIFEAIGLNDALILDASVKHYPCGGDTETVMCFVSMGNLQSHVSGIMELDQYDYVS
ncbi:MAG: RusA family crossover junction endodeoxyribonuclease [Candidatus Riesia sp.]|nr:RusA family crossover junction endodeoxyribonuclease [Candidatus Riesia sp.]